MRFVHTLDLSACSSMLRLKLTQQFRPHIIFNGFRFDAKDPRYSVPINAMKVRMRDNLPALIPRLVAYTNKSFQDDLPKKGQHSGTLSPRTERLYLC